MHLRNPNRLLSAISVGVLACLARAQDAGVAATFEIRGATRQISNVELGLELARRERHRPNGQEALELLVHKTLVSNAARKAGLLPTRQEIEATVEELGRKLEGRGEDLAAYLAEKNLSRKTFEESYIALAIAHEKLVVQSAGLRNRSQVTPELLALWLEEARSKNSVITDANELGEGIVARIGEEQLALTDLGDILRQNSSRSARDRAVRQIVVRELLADAAKQYELKISNAEIEDEISRRRKLIEADPLFRGASYEELLRSQGTSLEALRHSPVIRAQVYRRKLVEAELTDAVVTQRLHENRDAVLLRHGPRRHVNIILIRATDRPNQLIELDFDGALEKIRAVRKRLDDGMAFSTAARIHSEDPASKVKGGDVGRQSLMSKALPRAVLDAAYHIDPFIVSEPVRAAQGYYLVMVSEIEDPPGEAELRARLREEMAVEFVRGMIAAAKIELVE